MERRIAQLEAKLGELSEQLRLALQYVHSDSGSSLTKSRLVMEKLLVKIYEFEMDREPRKPLLGEMLADNQFTRKIDRRIIARANAIREMGNLGPHGETAVSSDAIRVLDDLCTVVEWYLGRYATEPQPLHPPTDLPSAAPSVLASGVRDVWRGQRRLILRCAGIALAAIVLIAGGWGIAGFLRDQADGRLVQPAHKGAVEGEGLQKSTGGATSDSGIAIPPQSGSTNAVIIALNDDLSKSDSKLRSSEGCRVTVTRRERVNDQDLGTEVLVVLASNASARVVIEWKTGDAGRKLLYVAGENDESVLVKPGGLKGKTMGGPLSFPYGAEAIMRESRLPPESYSLAAFTQLVRERLRPVIDADPSFVDCVVDDAGRVNGTAVRSYTLVFEHRTLFPPFRKVVVSFYKNSGLLAQWTAYGWQAETEPTVSDADEETLLESYFFTDPVILDEIPDQAFSKSSVFRSKAGSD